MYPCSSAKYFDAGSLLNYKNPQLRSSVRWHKIPATQKEMYKNINYVQRLGKYVKNVGNGWSPNCKESDSLNCVFNVSSISHNGIINFDNLKLSNETKPDFERFFAESGDLFVSRGNTVDLVALASIVENVLDDKPVIYPDLFMKVDVDDDHVNKNYLTYISNSIIGRLYFKYAAKGKNQTMVKISKDEIEGFYMPIPRLNVQLRLVNQIRQKLDAQEQIKQRISLMRREIDLIIEECISN